MFACKLNLENKIFACAARLKTEILSVDGSLKSFHASPYLQTLLALYNHFFAAENKRFCADEPKADLKRFFRAESTRLPSLKRAFCVPFFSCDFLSELAQMCPR